MQSRNLRGKAFSGPGIVILVFAGLSLFQALSPRAARAGDRREMNPMAPDLVAAIRDADAQAVRKRIDGGADVDARDADGNTPLILASFYASPDCVRLLLEKGADVNAANKAGVTALIRAATDYEKSRVLVNAGAKVGVRTADLGNTPLILATRRAGNARTVKLLLDRGADARGATTPMSVRSSRVRRAAIWRSCDCCWTPARTPTISRSRTIRGPPRSRRASGRR